MASRISGITIEINGDVTKLQSALKSTDDTLKSTQKALTDVNRLLKLDPSNTELVRQKHEMLTQAVQTTKERLQQLKDAQSTMDANGVDKNSEQYMALQREIIATEQKLKSLETQAVQTNSMIAAIGNAGENIKKVGAGATAAGQALAPVSAAAAGIGTAGVKAASDFDAAMSQVAATMGKPKAEIEALAELAKEQGEVTAFSATQAAEALNYLALAGYSEEQMAASLPSVLRLAAAGNMELAYASDLVTDSMSALGMSTSELDGFIDQMAKTASSSNTSVAQLGEAILVTGGQAKLCNLNTEELNTALGVLANNGIKGSEGGTALRNTLKNLYTPTEKAATTLARLGVETVNSDGSLRDIRAVLTDLGAVLNDMTAGDKVEKMAEIFDTRTIAPASALLKSVGVDVSDVGAEFLRSSELAGKYGEKFEGAIEDVTLALQRFGTDSENMQNAVDYLVYDYEMSAEDAATVCETLAASISTEGQEWGSLKEKIEDCDGAAQKMADTQLDNLNGQLTILGSGLEAAAISIGEALTPTISAAAAEVQKAVNWFNSLSDSVKQVIATALLITAAAAPVLLVIGTVLTKVGGLLTFLSGTVAPFITSTLIPAIGAISAPVLAVIAVVAALIASFAALYNSNEEFRDKVSDVWDSIKEVITLAIELIRSTISGFVEKAKEIWQEYGDDILSMAQAVWNAIFTAISTALTLIKDVISIISALIKGDWEGVWSGIKQFTLDLWEGIKQIIDSAINAGKQIISTVLAIISELWSEAWEGIKTKLSDAWESIKDIIQKLHDGISDKISDVKDVIKEKIGDAVEFIKELPEQALTWGKDLIGSFISGIKQKAADLIESVKDIAEDIADYIGFSEPEKGPLSRFHTFAPDMMRLFAKGIRDNMDLINGETERLAGAVSSGAKGGGQMQIRVISNTYLDGKLITRTVNDELGEML